MTSVKEGEELSESIDILPDEILLYIFKYLPLESIVACEHVCHRWRRLARDASIWRKLLLVYSGKPGQSEVSSRNLGVLSSHSKYIYRLKLQYIYNYSFIQAVTEKCYNIMYLELVMCRVGKEFEDDVIRWPQLKKLNLKNSLLISSGELKLKFDYFKKLNYLALSDFGLSSSNCNTLLNCDYLSHILIEKIKTLDVEFITMLILSKKNILKTLHIYGGDSINDYCLKLLSECPLLKDLAIIRSESLTDDGLLYLGSLKAIEHFQIWNNINFSEHNLLKTLSSDNLTRLETLSLSRIGNISPVIVDVISEYYKNLKFLALYQCPRIINTDYEKQLKSKFRNIDVVLY